MPKIKNPKFKHQISFQFTVEKSDHESLTDCLAQEKLMVINALMEKIGIVLSDDNQYIRSFSDAQSKV
jgi:hypothetical protein